MTSPASGWAATSLTRAATGGANKAGAGAPEQRANPAR